MFDWKHWRLSIDGTATEFELTEDDHRELFEHSNSVAPQQVMLEAVERWLDDGTAERPRGWSHDDETGTIDLWAPDRTTPGRLVYVSVFSDTALDTGYTVYDLSFVTAHEPGTPIRFRLEPYWPELEKQAAVMKDAGIICAFLDNLPDDVGLVRTTEMSGDDDVVENLYGAAVEKLLAEHFEIDLQQVAIERSKLLEYLSPSNETR